MLKHHICFGQKSDNMKELNKCWAFVHPRSQTVLKASALGLGAVSLPISRSVKDSLCLRRHKWMLKQTETELIAQSFWEKEISETIRNIFWQTEVEAGAPACELKPVHVLSLNLTGKSAQKQFVVMTYIGLTCFILMHQGFCLWNWRPSSSRDVCVISRRQSGSRNTVFTFQL